MTRRMERVNVLLRQEISRILVEELKDPRLSSLVSIIRVDTAPDLSTARVYISVLGNVDEKTNTMTALKSASGYVRRTVACVRSSQSSPPQCRARSRSC